MNPFSSLIVGNKSLCRNGLSPSRSRCFMPYELWYA